MLTRVIKYSLLRLLPNFFDLKVFKFIEIFCKFDFGENNLEHYGQEVPPNYDLTRVSVPVALYWSEDDWLAQPTDVQKIIIQLPNIISDYKVFCIRYDSTFHNLSFTYCLSLD